MFKRHSTIVVHVAAGFCDVRRVCTTSRGSGIHESLGLLLPDGGLHLPPTNVIDQQSPLAVVNYTKLCACKQARLPWCIAKISPLHPSLFCGIIKRHMIKRKIFEIIQPDCGKSPMSRAFDFLVTGLILVSVIAVFAGTFELSAGTSQTFEMIEKIASVVFTIEYALRIFTADLLCPELSPWKSRMKYIVSPMASIDLLAILPFWLPMILPGSLLGMRALRLVRLLRIFKLNRYFDAMRAIGTVIVEKKRELVGSMFFVVLLMLVTSLLMYSVEHDAQPEAFRNAFSGLWWAVATVTTVGYGDIYPITPLGRLLGALIAFSGIAAVAVPTGIITAGLSSVMERTKEPSKDREETACRHDKVEELCRALSENKEMLENILEILSKRKDKEP